MIFSDQGLLSLVHFIALLMHFISVLESTEIFSFRFFIVRPICTPLRISATVDKYFPETFPDIQGAVQLVPIKGV